jgi:hypothetical protein
MIKVGTYQALCKLEPRGDHGLEGYQAGQTYKCEYRTVGARDGKPYFRIWPVCSDDQPDYYETCSPAVFKRYFII